MVVYTRDNTVYADRPIMVFDRFGEQLLDLIECDTETGRVVRYRRDGHGNYIVSPAGDVETEELTVPSPLSVVPIQQEASG